MPIVILMCEAGGVLQWLQPLFLPHKFCGDSKWVLNPAQQQVSVTRPFFVTFADTHGVNAVAVLWGLFLSAWLRLYLTTTQKRSTHFHSNHHSGWHHHPFVEAERNFGRFSIWHGGHSGQYRRHGDAWSWALESEFFYYCVLETAAFLGPWMAFNRHLNQTRHTGNPVATHLKSKMGKGWIYVLEYYILPPFPFRVLGWCFNVSEAQQM